MPNYLSFNNVASQLQTQIFGTDGSVVRAIKTDSYGRLEVVGTFTAVGSITAIVTEKEVDKMVELSNVSGQNTALTVDTFGLKVYTFYVRNTGSNGFNVRLQISPVDIDDYYVNDSEVETAVGVGSTSKIVLVPYHFLKYTRLQYTATSGTITAVVWFNGRG